ncbi:hypothetical protein HAX54_017681, partial [Datura stramonium]|nr:hypothetical protein [Datura stramonium]
ERMVEKAGGKNEGEERVMVRRRDFAGDKEERGEERTMLVWLVVAGFGGNDDGRWWLRCSSKFVWLE